MAHKRKKEQPGPSGQNNRMDAHEWVALAIKGPWKKVIGLFNQLLIK